MSKTPKDEACSGCACRDSHIAELASALETIHKLANMPNDMAVDARFSDINRISFHAIAKGE